MRLLLATGVVLLASAGGAARADNVSLTGTVGPGFNISLSGPSGTVKDLDPGTYTLVIHDDSDIHDFHLFGPGNVDVASDIGNIETDTFTVTLVPGKYTFQCDAHPTSMKGTFTVGGATAATTTTTTTTTAPKPKAKPKAKPKPKPAPKKKKK